MQPTEVTDVATLAGGLPLASHGAREAARSGSVQPWSNSLVAGSAFTCARQDDGHVTCCGNGWHGELGNGEREDEGSPVEVEEIDDAVDLAAGTFHACVRRRDGSVWCWGENRWGQLGLPSHSDGALPREVPNLGRITQVSLGILHSCARRDDGVALCWGRNNVGQAGTGFASENDAPPAPVAGLGPVAQVAVGGGFSSCALLMDGTVRCWGENHQGQLGDGTDGSRVRPVPVIGLTRVAGIALGSAHGCAWLEDGTVQCWGAAGAMPLDTSTGKERSGVVPVDGVSNVVRVYAHEAYSCALRRDGSVRCWGYGVPRLRSPAEREARLWTPVGLPARVTALALGTDHLCALDLEGMLWCGGDDQHGQLCVGSSPPRTSTFGPPP
jgi:alpha-tubulin suppressor-like RCC1 family protein